MSDELAVIDVPALESLSLAQLAEAVNRSYERAEHHRERAEQHISEGVARALDAGAALLVARGRMETQEEWSAWFEENVVFEYWIAAKYMRYAYYRDELMEFSGSISMKTAGELLSGRPGIPKLRQGRQLSDDKIEAIKDLVAKGVPRMEVAEIVGVNHKSVEYHTSEAARKKLQRSSRRRQARIRAASAALQQKKREADARKVGGDASKLYSLVRQAAAVADSAASEANTPEVRSSLQTALQYLYKAEDHASAAIRKQV
jgi:hypothetical protein